MTDSGFPRLALYGSRWYDEAGAVRLRIHATEALMKRASHVGIIGLVLLIGPALPGLLLADGDEVSGDYRYAFHPPETTVEAQAHACREAARAAVSRSAAFRDATATLVDSAVTRDILDAVVRDALTDLQTIEQTAKGTTVSCAVKGRLDPHAITRILVTQMQGRPELTHPGLDRNRAVKILRVHEDQDGSLLIVFQALRRLDWLSTAYQGSLRDEASIMLEFYDEQGRILQQLRHPARKTPEGDDVMHPGEVGTWKVPKPSQAKSYRVWVAK